MRLQQYINEENTGMVDLFNKFESEIEENCQPYIRMIKNTLHVLVRYSESDINKVHRKYVRTERPPTDTDIAFHNLADDFFLKKFGWRARSNVVFCWGRKISHTRSFLVFPIGKFKFIWSPKVRDLWQYDPSNQLEIKNWDDVKDTYTDKYFHEALKTDREIMINCKEYYLLPPKMITLIMTRFMI